ncbi:ABC transporter permease [uncultured Marivita sp.]|uniref:ABC transporter permease n=1 Tax=uncultured Marivita sp. TaxID=888080 RepID=UPI00261DD319|nr:ABC transporter permease [uncultured Marivita sp.]
MANTMTTPATAERQSSLARLGTALLKLPPSIFVIVCLVVVSLALVPVLTKLPFQMVILRQAAPVGLVICAQLLVMRANSIDLSVGGVFILMNYLVTSSVLHGLPDGLVLVLPVLVAMVIGAINGFFVAVLRSSSVVVTLAMGSVLMGFVLLLSSGRPPGSAGDFIKWLGVGKIGIVPIAAIIWLTATLALEVYLRRSVYGRFVRVIGSNTNAAALSGIPVAKTLFTTHVLSAGFAGLGGVLLAGYIGMGSVKIGTDIVMTSIAGVILGGITFGKGQKSIIGAILAAYALAYVFNIMTALKFGEPAKLIVQGMIIFAASVVASVSNRKT